MVNPVRPSKGGRWCARTRSRRHQWLLLLRAAPETRARRVTRAPSPICISTAHAEPHLLRLASEPTSAAQCTHRPPRVAGTAPPSAWASLPGAFTSRLVARLSHSFSPPSSRDGTGAKSVASAAERRDPVPVAPGGTHAPRARTRRRGRRPTPAGAGARPPLQVPMGRSPRCLCVCLGACLPRVLLQEIARACVFASVREPALTAARMLARCHPPLGVRSDQDAAGDEVLSCGMGRTEGGAVRRRLSLRGDGFRLRSPVGHRRPVWRGVCLLRDRRRTMVIGVADCQRWVTRGADNRVSGGGCEQPPSGVQGLGCGRRGEKHATSHQPI